MTACSRLSGAQNPKVASGRGGCAAPPRRLLCGGYQRVLDHMRPDQRVADQVPADHIRPDHIRPVQPPELVVVAARELPMNVQVAYRLPWGAAAPFQVVPAAVAAAQVVRSRSCRRRPSRR
jgi:hypothetical protein